MTKVPIVRGTCDRRLTRVNVPGQLDEALIRGKRRHGCTAHTIQMFGRPMTPPVQDARPRHVRIALALLTAIAGLASCAVQLENPRPARELQAERTPPPGSIYAGWRVYVDRCAACHALDATGSANAPNLLQRVGAMGPNTFVARVLWRYEWDLPSPPPATDAQGRQAVEGDVLQRRAGLLEMPAWQGEPRVTAHIADLYTYLAARAEGTLGPGRPAP